MTDGQTLTELREEIAKIELELANAPIEDDVSNSTTHCTVQIRYWRKVQALQSIHLRLADTANDPEMLATRQVALTRATQAASDWEKRYAAAMQASIAAQLEEAIRRLDAMEAAANLLEEIET